MKIGFLNLLTVIFIIAKLCKAIDWSWWLVLLPTIINVALIVLILMVAAWGIAEGKIK